MSLLANLKGEQQYLAKHSLGMEPNLVWQQRVCPWKIPHTAGRDDPQGKRD